MPNQLAAARVGDDLGPQLAPQRLEPLDLGAQLRARLSSAATLRAIDSSCSSSSNTRSTPARFIPSSAVISWIRRSRSTSSCEYRRVPFGERLGSISPRASYIRSVCGCISASSAATEIMNTPRSEETSTRVVRDAPGGHQSALRRGRAVGRRAVGEQPRARIAVHHLGQPVDRLGLLRRQRSPARRSRTGSGCRRGPCRRAAAGPRRAAAGRCRAWSRRGTRSRFEPFSVGTSITAPWIASGIVSGTSTSRLSPLRLNTGDSDTRVITYRSPGSAPRSPGSPLPASRIRLPSRTPAGMLTRSRRTRRWAPVPSHVGHGSSITVPEPWQFEHGWEIEKIPWLWASTPRPLQTGQTFGAVPGLAPDAVTGRARLRGRHRERHLGAVDRLVEAQRDLGLEVAAARLTRLPAAHAAGPRPPPAPPRRRTGWRGCRRSRR